MLDRVKGLDGLRGVAVILVIALHTFKRADYFTANPILHFITSLTYVGWVGVDIFFVLSGFLITGILLHSKGKERYFRNFYARRALRIFPLYYFAIAVLLPLGVYMEPEFAPYVRNVLPWLLLYQQNWLSILLTVPLTTYLAVTWSLAIEEQFYLVWPTVVYYFDQKRLAWIGGAVIGLSILARIIGVLFWHDMYQMTGFFYFSTFTRLEELIFGAMLALAFTREDWRKRISATALPVFVVSLAVFLFMVYASDAPHHPQNNTDPTLTLAGYTLSAIVSSSLIAILVNHPETSLLRKFFQNKILVFFGQYSYSMYLFHMPLALALLDILWHTGRRGWDMFVIYLVLTWGGTIIISQLTWNLLEKHMLNLKKYFE